MKIDEIEQDILPRMCRPCSIHNHLDVKVRLKRQSLFQRFQSPWNIISWHRTRIAAEGWISVHAGGGAIYLYCGLAERWRLVEERLRAAAAWSCISYACGWILNPYNLYKYHVETERRGKSRQKHKKKIW